jgi:mRNA interferase MazF
MRDVISGYKKDFDGWNFQKKLLDHNGLLPYFKIREVWFCAMGVNVGYEQDGKNSLFERPVLVLRKFNKEMFWGVPLSTKVKPGNNFYFTFIHQNNEYSAVIYQLRLLSARRLTRKLYALDSESFAHIRNKVLSSF